MHNFRPKIFRKERNFFQWNYEETKFSRKTPLLGGGGATREIGNAFVRWEMVRNVWFPLLADSFVSLHSASLSPRFNVYINFKRFLLHHVVSNAHLCPEDLIINQMSCFIFCSTRVSLLAAKTKVTFLWLWAGIFPSFHREISSKISYKKHPQQRHHPQKVKKISSGVYVNPSKSFKFILQFSTLEDRKVDFAFKIYFKRKIQPISFRNVLSLNKKISIGMCLGESSGDQICFHSSTFIFN